MSEIIDDVFGDGKEVEEASGSKGGDYFKPGNFIVELDKIKVDKTWDGTHYFVADLVVVKSSIPDVIKVGDRKAFYTQKHPKYPSMFMADVKHFLQATQACYLLQNNMEKDVPKDIHCKNTGITINKDVIGWAVGEDQPMRGTEMRLYVFEKPKKHTPTEMFTHHNFQQYNGKDGDKFVQEAVKEEAAAAAE